MDQALRPCWDEFKQATTAKIGQWKGRKTAKNDTKMGLNCNIDREKHKYNSKIPTAFKQNDWC